MPFREKLFTIPFPLSNQVQRRLLRIAVTILASALGISLVLSFNSPRTILLLGVSTALVIFWKPVLGLALYLVVYPLVPAEESLNPLKIAVFCLFILIFSAWLISKTFHKERLFSRPENRYLYIFFLFLCFSPLLGVENNFGLIDWARDIAPLLNLLLIPIMADYFNKKENHWLLYLVFTLWILSTLQNIFLLLSIYDVPYTDWVYTLPRIIPLHPSLGVGLGLLMCLSKTPRWRFWLTFSIMNLTMAFLTPGRTIWITTLTILLLIVIFSSNKRPWATVATGILVLTMGFLFFKGGSASYVELQRERLQKLVEYRYDLSFENRLEEINQTGELFLSAPVWGVGFGYQYDFWRPFITGIGPGFLDTNYTHNDIMYIASKGGLIGLILFGLMLYGIGKKLLQRRKENRGSIESAWATIALIALINSLIIGLSTPVFQTRNAVFALAILLALGLGYKGTESNAR
jgi:O-antigen ligase